MINTIIKYLKAGMYDQVSQLIVGLYKHEESEFVQAVKREGLEKKLYLLLPAIQDKMRASFFYELKQEGCYR